MLLLRLVLLFTLVPFIELVLLLWISSKSGMVFTIALVVATGVVGAALARRQGMQTWRRIQQQVARGETPAGAMLDGLMILVAGALLITPGVLTDLLGFSLLVPVVRETLKRRVTAWFKERAVVEFRAQHQRGPAGFSERPDDAVIDADFVRQPADTDDCKP